MNDQFSDEEVYSGHRFGTQKLREYFPAGSGKNVQVIDDGKKLETESRLCLGSENRL